MSGELKWVTNDKYRRAGPVEIRYSEASEPRRIQCWPVIEGHGLTDNSGRDVPSTYWSKRDTLTNTACNFAQVDR